jgi:hypothetical protein
MGRYDARLPSTIELRERSRSWRDAARKAVDPAAKREIAAYAFALAQVAEAMERDPTSMTSDAFGRLVQEALERAGMIVHEVIDKIGRASADAAKIRAWRMRAEELRTTADGFAVPSAQETLRRAAANYDRLADQAETSFARRPPEPQDDTA